MWIITFDSYKQYFKDGNKIPKFHCEVSQRPRLFAFDESTNEWTEQSSLFPGTPQRQDLMGASKVWPFMVTTL